MQLALKSISNFSTADFKTLIDETCRLELAGVTSAMTKERTNIYSVSENRNVGERNRDGEQINMVEQITESNY